MSAVTGSQVEHVDLDDHDDDDDRPWYRSPSVLIPIASGVAFAAGLVCEWTGAETAGLVLFWIGLLLGAYTFVPGALRMTAELLEQRHAEIPRDRDVVLYCS